LQRIMTSSAVRIRAVPPFRIGLLKNIFQDRLEVSKDTITYNSKFVHISAPRIPPAPSCAADTKSPQKGAEAKQNPFPPTKIVLLCLVRIVFRPATLPRNFYGRTPKRKNVPCISDFRAPNFF